LWVGSKPHDVYIGTRAFAACRGDEVLAAETVDGVDASLEALTAWLKDAAPKRMNLWLSGTLCRPMLLKPVEGLKTHAEWLRVAESMVALQTGLAEPCEVWVERRAPGAAPMAAAISKAMLARLLEVAGRSTSRCRVVRIGPWWAEPLRASLGASRAPKALAVRDCDSLTLLTGQAQEFESVALYAPVSDEAAAQSALSRALMNVDCAPGEELVARLAVAQPGPGNAAAYCALARLTEWSQ
jgi:hypothetical protein